MPDVDRLGLRVVDRRRRHAIQEEHDGVPPPVSADHQRRPGSPSPAAWMRRAIPCVTSGALVLLGLRLP